MRLASFDRQLLNDNIFTMMKNGIARSTIAFKSHSKICAGRVILQKVFQCVCMLLALVNLLAFKIYLMTPYHVAFSAFDCVSKVYGQLVWRLRGLI